MNVTLERFADTYSAAVRQGLDIYQTVRDNRSGLKEYQPGTVTRFRDRRHAIYNTRRLGSFGGDYHPYLIRQEEEHGRSTVLGLATLMTRQTIIHPVMGEVFGTDIDYWTIPDQPENTHRTIGDLLVRERGRLALQLIQEGYRVPAHLDEHSFAVLHIGNYLKGGPDVLTGITTHSDFIPYGPEAPLRVPEGTVAPYTDIARDGRPSQLFVSRETVPVPPAPNCVVSE